ncbi:hypothetical protein [Xenorhabdus anantnagensis]|uniref:Lipoprotein n=1 Tax=Xenorhabdus anantnagensis TaxID=3025875 RepID=A0ABT5LRY5_9GAMM|nr:hypothetical protein [Xenorhabdus anantnagensis]MDC9596481.1 hypothetical protein [Xenorhabdus anantnagensis]
MKRLAKVLFSLLLVLLPFSGHSFQAPDTATNIHQISLIKIPKTPKTPKTPNKQGNELSSIKHTYKSIKDAPQYPKGFRPVQDGTTRNVVNNKKVLQDLRAVRAGQWYKIYKNGYSASNQRVSIHYFQHKSGLVFDVKVHHGWSIRGS